MTADILKEIKKMLSRPKWEIGGIFIFDRNGNVTKIQ